MKRKYAIALVLVAVLMVVGLVACGQAENQQEQQDLNAQQTTPVTDVPTVEPTVEPAQTVEPVEADAQGEAGTAVGTSTTSGATETPQQATSNREVLSGDELIAEFEFVYNYCKEDNDFGSEEEKIDFELAFLGVRAGTKGKDLPADYKERYIDWRPIDEDDSEEGSLVDTSTPTGTGTGTGSSGTGTGTGSGTGTGTGTGGGISGSGGSSLEGFTLEEQISAWQDGSWREKGLPAPPPDLEDYIRNYDGESGYVDGSQLDWDDFDYPDGVGFY